jgi:hypothetical protein
MLFYLSLCAGRRYRSLLCFLFIWIVVVFPPVDKALPPDVGQGPKVPTQSASKIQFQLPKF